MKLKDEDIKVSYISNAIEVEFYKFNQWVQECFKSASLWRMGKALHGYII